MIPNHERRILEAHVRKVRLSQLDFLRETELDEYQKRELKELIKQRMKGVPLQYLTNIQAFYGRDFYVNTAVLVPRPETEGLVEHALKRLPRPVAGQRINVLEFGTGSGCIGITVALERPDARVWASEASVEAYGVAVENARNHRAINIDFLQVSDPPALWQYGDIPAVDLLVSNPPYLVHEDDITDEVRTYEPPEALFAPTSDDPTFYYRFLAELAQAKLTAHGFGFFEIAEHRVDATATVFHEQGFETEVHRDLTERPRYLLAYRPGHKPEPTPDFDPFQNMGL